MSKKLNFAVIGCGTVSGYGHLPTIAAMTEQARLAAVVDIDPPSLENASRKYPQADDYADYRAALDRSDIDAVVIATRTDSHVEIALAALQAGKHILLEKPPAATVSEARRLLHTARQTDRICATGFILRYARGFQQIKQWRQAGAIGTLRAVRMIDDWWGADHRGKWPGREERLLVHDGSVMVAEGIHHADMARWLTGSEFGAIQCVGTTFQLPAIPTHQVLIARMANGVVVNLECSHSYGYSSRDPIMDHQVDLIGDGGVIKWWETTGKLVLYGREETCEIQVPEAKQFEAMYADFIESIHTGRPSNTLPTLEDGVKALEAVCLASQKAEQFDGG